MGHLILDDNSRARFTLSVYKQLSDAMFVERTFHPIGQGGFYTEVIRQSWCSSEKFVVVYDCGTLSNKEHAKQVIDEFFSSLKEKKIDLLIISHFDADHVNLIPYLFEKGIQISKVLVPYVSKEEFALTYWFCAAQESKEDRDSALNVLAGVFPNYATELGINESNELFAESTVLYVDAIEEDGGEFESDESKAIEDINEPFSKIGGTSKLTTNCAAEWFLIPRNHDFKNQRANLCLKLFVAGMSCSDLSSAQKLKDPSSLKLLRSIYNKLHGTVNQTSLLVLTGIRSTIGKISSECLLTGDFPTKQVPLKSLFPKGYCENLALAQIPHHGSASRFDLDNFLPSQSKAIAVVHAGQTNSYNHPHTTTMGEVSKRVAGTVVVTENSKLTTFC